MITTESPSTKQDKETRVCAVIVTFNRLALLKEAFAAVRNQTRPADTIIVVDNGSTDGTSEWLATVIGAGVRVITQANLGGAGGFYTGLQAGYESGADWFWCMDDDTIPDPECLARILAVEVRVLDEAGPATPGWISSVVRWTDGTAHRMNEPKVESFLRWGPDVLRKGFIPAQWCSFVSVAISRQAVAACGLPLKDMFIWYDDVEYTARITAAGFAGVVALESQVEHRTATNYAPDVEDLAPNNLWRFRYAFRNEVVVLKTLNRNQPNKLYLQFGKLMLRRLFLMLRAGKFGYLPVAISQGFRGLSFPMDILFPQAPTPAVSDLHQNVALPSQSLSTPSLTSPTAS